MGFKNFANKRGMNNLNIKAKERIPEEMNSDSENISEKPIETFMTEHQGSKFADIPTKDIKLNEHNTYRKFDNDEIIKEYAESIDRDNLLQIITVCYDKNDKDKYILISGERRYRAMSYLGWETIPCWVINTTDEADARVKLHIANLKSRSATMTPSEKLESYRDLRKAVELRHAETGDTSSVSKECAKIMQLSKRQTQRYSAMLKDIEILTGYGVSEDEIRKKTEKFSLNEISRFVKGKIDEFEKEKEQKNLIPETFDNNTTQKSDKNLSYPIFRGVCNGELKQGVGLNIDGKFIIVNVIKNKDGSYSADFSEIDNNDTIDIVDTKNCI